MMIQMVHSGSRRFASSSAEASPPGKHDKTAALRSCHRLVTRGAESRGLSLVEAVISVAIVTLLLTSVLSIAIESVSLLADTEVDYLVQIEGDRALSRITEILRKSGRVEEKGIPYPRVLAGGGVLEFRLPGDIDGDGRPFDEKTTAVEWSPHVFSMQVGPDGTLAVHRSGTEVYAIAHDVRFLRFATARENPKLHLEEIAVDVEIQKSLETGDDVVFSLSGSAHMRN